jgi:hypothetical protein
VVNTHGCRDYWRVDVQMSHQQLRGCSDAVMQHMHMMQMQHIHRAYGSSNTGASYCMGNCSM